MEMLNIAQALGPDRAACGGGRVPPHGLSPLRALPRFLAEFVGSGGSTSAASGGGALNTLPVFQGTLVWVRVCAAELIGTLHPPTPPSHARPPRAHYARVHGRIITRQANSALLLVLMECMFRFYATITIVIPI